MGSVLASIPELTPKYEVEKKQNVWLCHTHPLRDKCTSPEGQKLTSTKKKKKTKHTKRYQLAAITPCSPNTHKSQRGVQDCAAQHQCSQDFQESPDSLGLAQPTAAPCLGEGSRLGGHTQGPRGAAHHAHCPWAASRTWGSSSLLPCRGPQWSPSKFLFGVFHAPSQEAIWKLLNKC